MKMMTLIALLLFVACEKNGTQKETDTDLSPDTGSLPADEDALLGDEPAGPEDEEDAVVSDDTVLEEDADEVVPEEIIPEAEETDEMLPVEEEAELPEEDIENDQTQPDDDLVPGTASCREILTCSQACGTDMDCQQTCYQNGSSIGKDRYDAVTGCLLSNCVQSSDPSEYLSCAGEQCPDEISNCFSEDFSLPPYGTLNAGEETFSHIYDGDGDLESQIQDNPNGGVMQAFFTGSYGSQGESIPYPGTLTVAIAMHYAPNSTNPASVVVRQESAPQTGTRNFVVRLIFPTDALGLGFSGMNSAVPGDVNLMLFEKVGDSECLMAMSFGGVTFVSGAQNTTAASGGSIRLGVIDALLYHPTETPYGDLSGEVAEMTLCPIE